MGLCMRHGGFRYVSSKFCRLHRSAIFGIRKLYCFSCIIALLPEAPLPELLDHAFFSIHAAKVRGQVGSKLWRPRTVSTSTIIIHYLQRCLDLPLHIDITSDARKIMRLRVALVVRCLVMQIYQLLCIHSKEISTGLKWDHPSKFDAGLEQDAESPKYRTILHRHFLGGNCCLQNQHSFGPVGSLVFIFLDTVRTIPPTGSGVAAFIAVCVIKVITAVPNVARTVRNITNCSLDNHFKIPFPSSFLLHKSYWSWIQISGFLKQADQ